MKAEQKEGRPRPRRRRASVWRLIGQDILLTCLVLLTFALFHHVLPRYAAGRAGPAALPAAPLPQSSEQIAAPLTDAEESPIPTTETLSWRERFAEHFTETTEASDERYSSDKVSVRVETVTCEINGRAQRYYVADIYIARIECFRTGAAYNGFTRYAAEDAVELDKASGAIVQINGDYCNTQRSGLLVRNGEVYYSDPPNCDICVLYYDGRMETYAADAYDAEELLERAPYQVWKFGPALLDENGCAQKSFHTSRALQNRHPRTGLGYYEPGHYCFVVADGRQHDAAGLTMDEWAAVFEGLGCRCAYNLDGGASSVMTFHDRVCNVPSSYRPLGDTLYICEPEV